MAATVLLAYLGTMLWTARVSVSSSRTFPASDFVGAAQYIRLFNNERWLLSLQNVAVYGVLFIAPVWPSASCWRCSSTRR
jgi:glucose/mannose transport system permease protein